MQSYDGWRYDMIGKNKKAYTMEQIFKKNMPLFSLKFASDE